MNLADILKNVWKTCQKDFKNSSDKHRNAISTVTGLP